jgi:predicted metalloprotease
MRFDQDDFGSDVEDRGRGSGGGGFGFGGGGFGGGGGLGMILPLILSRFGLGGIVILGIILFASGGLNGMLGDGGGQQVVGSSPPAAGGGSSGAVRGEQACRTDESKRFACNVNGSVEKVWSQLLAQSGQTFRPAGLTFYQGGTRTACGAGETAMGPFYCPGDRRIYLDTSFFRELASRFQASGDFAQAYVVAHEWGHHIQTLIGVEDRIRRGQQGASEAQSNALQVRMELQADCLAGVWGANVSRSGDTLDAGDLEEGLQAAQAIGDDTLQRSAGRTPVPESFTHGTSAQRQQALQRGFQGATLNSCLTYTQGL